jgi:hypothetical protein
MEITIINVMMSKSVKQRFSQNRLRLKKAPNFWTALIDLIKMHSIKLMQLIQYYVFLSELQIIMMHSIQNSADIGFIINLPILCWQFLSLNSTNKQYFERPLSPGMNNCDTQFELYRLYIISMKIYFSSKQVLICQKKAYWK